MDFEWSEDQIAFRKSVIGFAQRELNEDLDQRDKNGMFSRESWDKCAEFGLLGLPFPTQYGGQGADVITTMLAMEALGYGCRDNGLIFSMNAHMWSATVPINRFGTSEQKQRYLPGLCAGTLIGVQGMTEPGSGSDAYGLSTTARLVGGRYILNGAKTFITNAPIADIFVVFATLDPSKGWAGLCAFLVDRDTPGLTIGPPFDKMGLRTSPMSELVFDDCEVPAENLLSKQGAGMMVFNHSIEWERSCILASSIGAMERQVEECVAYGRERSQFGRPIGKFQGVSHKIVDMKLRLETSRLLLYRLGWLHNQGKSTPLDASLVKLHLSDSLISSSLDAMAVHGAYGYMTESGLERDLRDALASRIYSGTSEIQKNVVASQLGL